MVEIRRVVQSVTLLVVERFFPVGTHAFGGVREELMMGYQDKEAPGLKRI
jgi:hypothetical protein